MKWKEVGIMNIFGENLTPDLKPSIESEMHLSIYKKKKEIKAIVHAHPVFASAFTAMKCKINTNLTAEACAILGDPVLSHMLLWEPQIWHQLLLKILFNLIFFFLKTMGFLQPDQIFCRLSTRLKYLKMLLK